MNKFAALFVAAILSMSQVFGLEAPLDFSITGFKIYSYSTGNGAEPLSFIPIPDPKSIWNSIGSVVVVVEVTQIVGEWGYPKEPRPSIRLSAVKKSKEFFNQTAKVTENGKSYVGFWLPQGYCDPITVTAKLEYKERVSEKSENLQFSCGE